jgi:diguanylate cyclase (GGDEF)-like protein
MLPPVVSGDKASADKSVLPFVSRGRLATDVSRRFPAALGGVLEWRMMALEPTNPPLEGLRSLVDLCDQRACLVDPHGWRVVYANRQLAQFVGSPSESPVGKTVFDLVPGLETPAIRQLLVELADGTRAEARIDRRPGSDQVAESVGEFRARRVETANGVLVAIVVGNPASEGGRESGRREGIDPLTGLADRSFILGKLAAIFHGDRQEDQRCAVLFIDVDGFKQVNDVHGHLVGDRVLGEVARRLTESVRLEDRVARFGGDEFLVLLERIGDCDDFAPLVRRIQAAFAQPIALPQGEVTLSVSVGAARAGHDGNTPEALIDAADRAMYAAKRATA